MKKQRNTKFIVLLTLLVDHYKVVIQLIFVQQHCKYLLANTAFSLDRCLDVFQKHPVSFPRQSSFLTNSNKYRLLGRSNGKRSVSNSREKHSNRQRTESRSVNLRRCNCASVSRRISHGFVVQGQARPGPTHTGRLPPTKNNVPGPRINKLASHEAQRITAAFLGPRAHFETTDWSANCSSCLSLAFLTLLARALLCR